MNESLIPVVFVMSFMFLVTFCDATELGLVGSIRQYFNSNQSNSNHSNHGLHLRRQLFKKKSFPDVFLIGERKCATTSLKKLIVYHPEICPTQSHHEMHFFDTKYFAAGKSYYSTYFEGCDSKEYFTMDGTPGYIRDLQPLQNMIDYYGIEDLKQKKFIVSFREPLAAQFSWYGHRIRNCLEQMNKFHKKALASHDGGPLKLRKHEGLCDHYMCSSVGCRTIELDDSETIDHEQHLFSFKEYVESEGFIQTDGHFLEHLKNWVNNVGRDRILVLKFDDLIKNTTMVTKAIAKFIGFEHDFGDNVEFPHSNDSGFLNITSDCATWDRLQEYYNKVNEGIADYINNDPKKPPMEPAFTPFQTKRKCV